ncbi:hypothetical protein HWV62_12498 [Athelia sp. TMB]|nr:hypothetical protein HWV62_12498 [Athelia sp. TMB]
MPTATGQTQSLLSRAVHLPTTIFTSLLATVYVLIQRIIVLVFAPPPPPAQWAGWNGTDGELGTKGGRTNDEDRNDNWNGIKPHGRIAVVGAGLTGVSSAAHAIAHGFSPIIFEASPYEASSEDAPPVGGIWTHVNSSSGLQLNSLLYRFFPGVRWSRAFPLRDEILGEVRRVWETYGLKERTRFGTRVSSIRRAPSDYSAPDGHTRWVINDGAEGIFDAVIVTVGTCGEPKWVKFPGMPEDYGSVKRFESSANKSGIEGSSAAGNEDTPQSPSDGPAQDSGEHSDSESGDDEQGDDAEHLSKSQKRKIRKRKQLAREDEDVSSPSAASFHTASQNTSARTDGESQPSPKQERKSEKDGKDEEGATPFTRGPVLHSSQLDSLPRHLLAGKRVVIIGSGASAVEAVETVLGRTGDGEKEDRAKCIVLARDDKWIIPRNIIFDTLIAAQPFGREMPLSFIWEQYLARTQYARTPEMLPHHRPIFAGTPVVNDEFLGHVADGRCEYLRCDPIKLTPKGVLINLRTRESRPGDAGKETEVAADVVVLATGFEKPTIDFLPDDLFPEGYERPNLYLQNFATEDWSVLMTNSSYNGPASHIGIYTRILLTLLLDPGARPEKKDMKLWVDVVRYIKRGASGGALGFFTYAELRVGRVSSGKNGRGRKPVKT